MPIQNHPRESDPEKSQDPNVCTPPPATWHYTHGLTLIPLQYVLHVRALWTLPSGIQFLISKLQAEGVNDRNQLN